MSDYRDSEVDGMDVTVQQRDFETGALVEEAQYRYETGDGFVQEAAWTDWDGDRFAQ